MKLLRTVEMADEPSENDQEWDTLRLREDEEMEFFTELALHEAERWIQVRVRFSRVFSDQSDVTQYDKV